MDGAMNIWILKPGNKSRGRGIILMNKLEDIIAKVTPTNKATDTRFVVQKYIGQTVLHIINFICGNNLFTYIDFILIT
jgi:tubulin monoglycylase TTLL3/8